MQNKRNYKNVKKSRVMKKCKSPIKFIINGKLRREDLRLLIDQMNKEYSGNYTLYFEVMV